MKSTGYRLARRFARGRKEKKTLGLDQVCAGTKNGKKFILADRRSKIWASGRW
jgi:hypothetical protein